jgi:hypothetical protein
MNQPESDPAIFVDRRKMPEDLRSVMASEFSEWNKRRDDNLKAKLEALEKFANLALATRADALSIGITRIQGDTTACAMRCHKQVAEFYTLINNLEKGHIRELEKAKAHEVASEKTFYDIAFELKAGVARSARHRKELDTKIDSLEKDLKKRVETLENWRALDWKQTLIYVGAVLLGLMQIFTWAQKFIHIDS